MYVHVQEYNLHSYMRSVYSVVIHIIICVLNVHNKLIEIIFIHRAIQYYS